MGDDDAIPVAGGGARQETLALGPGEIHVIGDQDFRVGVEKQELAAGLCKAMAWHDHHGFVHQAKALLLDNRRGHGEGFPGADRMRHVRAARGDDPPDNALLVRVEIDHGAGAGQRQMRAIEMARHHVVHGGVVDVGKLFGPLRLGPDPVLKSGFDLKKLFLGGLGFLRVQLASLLPVLVPDVPDLRDRGVERVVHEMTGMTARRAPFGGGAGLLLESLSVDHPGAKPGDMPHRGFDAEDFLAEQRDDLRWNPGCAEACGDFGRLQIDWLRRLQGFHIGGKTRFQHRHRLRDGELGTHRPGEIGIGRLPGAIFGV